MRRRYRKGRSGPAGPDRARIERAAELYLAVCYRGRTAARADEFARFLQVARPYLSRVASGAMGIPIRDYLRSKQLAYARQLLRATPLTVEEIAVASAFGTGWTFHRCFKAAFGVTPAEYRRQVTECE